MTFSSKRNPGLFQSAFYKWQDFSLLLDILMRELLCLPCIGHYRWRGDSGMNHRMVWIGRNLKDNLIPASLPWGGTTVPFPGKLKVKGESKPETASSFNIPQAGGGATF